MKNQPSANVTELLSMAKLKSSNQELKKANNLIVKELNSKQALLASIKDLITKPRTKIKIKKATFQNNRKMVMELMLSDIHIGKKTDNFNLSVAEQRLNDLVGVFTSQFELHKKSFKIEGIILALIGDIIESQTMHELESAKGCEFGNSRQVQESIRLLFFHAIVPIAKLGVKVIIPAVTGNHDRTEMRKTMNNPGEDNVTYIIYHTLELMAKAYDLKNVSFLIPKGPYQLVQVFNNVILYEHGDNAKAKTEVALEALLHKRQAQSGTVIDFMRVGHFHSYACFGRGRIIVNDSLPGADSYSQVMGFNSHAGQALNLYIETSVRPNCFYSSFPIYLK